MRDEGVVAPGKVEDTRAHRDILWELVKVRFVHGSEISTENAQAYADELKDLPTSFEDAVQQADSIADQRFEKAQAAAELAVLARNLADQEVLIEQLEAGKSALTSEGERLDQAWRAIWAGVPIEVAAPDAMLAWLNTRNDIVTLIRRQREAQRQFTDCRSEEKDAIMLVQAALTKLGWHAEDVRADALRVIVERAEGFRRDQEAKPNGSMRCGKPCERRRPNGRGDRPNGKRHRRTGRLGERNGLRPSPTSAFTRKTSRKR